MPKKRFNRDLRKEDLISSYPLQTVVHPGFGNCFSGLTRLYLKTNNKLPEDQEEKKIEHGEGSRGHHGHEKPAVLVDELFRGEMTGKGNQKDDSDESDSTSETESDDTDEDKKPIKISSLQLQKMMSQLKKKKKHIKKKKSMKNHGFIITD